MTSVLIFLSFLYKQFLDQVLVTYGFVYVITNATLWIWGPLHQLPYVPEYLSGSVLIGKFTFPFHRFAIIGVGLVMAAGLWWLQDKTRYGAIVRAGMEDAEMIGGLGINLRPITIGAFFFGSMIAGLAAALGTPLLGGMYAWLGMDMLWVAMIVCIIGGMGSIQGALVGALILGLIDTFGKMYFPEFAMFTSYMVAIIILLAKPQGLLGRKM